MADAHGEQAYKRSGSIVLRYGSRRSDTPGLSNPGSPLFCSGCCNGRGAFPDLPTHSNLYQLNLAEGERDRWQRPDDVIESLKLKDGNVVADVGCGVGYFSLKLASKVAEHGSVLAEDILGESLTFLWIRAFLDHQSNIRVIHGNLDDPHLPKGGVDAVLIANSYHEFTKPLAILDHTFRALRSDGRLVVLDRGPRSYHGEPREIQMQQYQIAASIAEDEIRQRGFEVISRDDRFIDRPAAERPSDRPDDHVWWLIVANREAIDAHRKSGRGEGGGGGTDAPPFRSKPPGRLSGRIISVESITPPGWEAKALAGACIFDIQRTERRASEWQNFRSNDHLRTVTRFCKAI